MRRKAADMLATNATVIASVVLVVAWLVIDARCGRRGR
jgi:hypothetical protein